VSIRNQLSEAKRRAVIEAMGDLGWDGRGRDGARGYLRRQAVLRPRGYLRLFFRCAQADLARELIISSRTEQQDGAAAG
jgi:hypothetical protein